MNKSISQRTNVASALLCLMLFASCSADEGTALPEGKYPMTFATAMEGLTQTRATTDNTWAGDEKIAVQVGGEVKEYTPTASGAEATLTGTNAVNTFYWQHAGETKLVSAWYCGDGSAASGQANATRLPKTWTVKTDQSSNGYAESDFLYVTPTDISFSNRGSKRLSFNHLPAKVIIHLKSGDGLTAADVEGATVRIVSQATTSGTIDAANGTVVQTTNPGAEAIIPNVLAAPKSGYQKSVQAIVVPQKVAAGTRFIKVTIGTGDVACDYYYTTETDNDANLECGNQYAYEITVTKTGLSVAPVTIGGWTDSSIESGIVDKAIFRVKLTGGPLPNNFALEGIKTTATGNVYETTDGSSFSISYTTSNRAEVPVFTIEKGMATGTRTEISNGDGTTTYTYTCTNIRSDLWINHLAAGYYYYADGTWSSVYTDVGPACIGIVFWVGDATTKDATLKSDHPECTHGLVVALQDAAEERTPWQSSPSSVQSWLNNHQSRVYLSVKSGTGSSEPLNNIQGYNNTKAIEEFNAAVANNGNIVQAVVKAADYRNATSAPDKSSKWYLPSAKELTLLCGEDVDNIWSNNSGGTANRDLINGKLSSISSVATTISSAYYWSSTEPSSRSYSAFYVSFGDGDVDSNDKFYAYRVRCVLAF